MMSKAIDDRTRKVTLYKPKNPDKYAGDVNSIYVRSGWEWQFYKIVDSDPRFTKWAVEELYILYENPLDKKLHRYFPDVLVEAEQKDGKKKTYLIEIKPYKETVAPRKRTYRTKTYIKESSTFAINQAKWKAAEEFCRKKGWKFLILTEKHINFG